MRTETPALNTGMSPDAFGLSVSCTLLVLDHANPPSRNGETVVGRYGKLISPILLDPEQRDADLRVHDCDATTQEARQERTRAHPGEQGRTFRRIERREVVPANEVRTPQIDRREPRIFRALTVPAVVQETKRKRHRILEEVPVIVGQHRHEVQLADGRIDLEA